MERYILTIGFLLNLSLNSLSYPDYKITINALTSENCPQIAAVVTIIDENKNPVLILSDENFQNKDRLFTIGQI